MTLLKLKKPMMRGDDILNIQKALKPMGLYTGELDGIFGQKTYSAVKLFQKKTNITVDGIVGPQTMQKLKEQFPFPPKTSHFQLSEFKCKDGTPVPKEYWNNLQSLMNMLERVRTACGNKPIVIVSGYRTPEYNKKVNGADKSQHLYGKAADIKATGIKPDNMLKIADKTVGDAGGVGRYPYFTHIDIRGYRARW